MSRVIAFLLLFGAGLMILYAVDEGVEPEVAGADSSKSRQAIPPIPSNAPHGVGIRGRFDGVLYDDRTKRALLRIVSADSRSQALEDVLTQVHVDVLDSDSASESILGRIDAREASLPRTQSSDAFRPTYRNIVTLREVRAVLEGALPFSSPLSIQSPGAELRATDPEHVILESDEALSFESAELSGTSNGYLIDVMRSQGASGGVVPDASSAEDMMELRRDGRIEFRSTTPEGDQEARMWSTGEGAMQVRRIGGPQPRPILLEAWDGAYLELGGPYQPTLAAEHLVLKGSSAKDDDLIRLRRLDADGNVRWDSSQGRYSANRCTLHFDELSQLAQAELEGFPSVRVFLSLDPDQLLGLSSEERQALAELESVLVASEDAIELEVFTGEGLAFRAAGPATVEASEVKLRSNGDVLARLSEDGRTIALSGSAGVIVESQDASLLTANFELTVLNSDDASAGLHGVAWNGTRLEGKSKDGRHFVVTSPNRLEVQRREEAWRVIDGREVQVSVGELGMPGAFFARCDHLANFDIEAGRFEATGNVEFEGEGRHVTGHRLLAHGPKDLEIWGETGKPVEFESSEGDAQAAYVHVDGDRLTARGQVTANLSGDVRAATGQSPTDTTVQGMAFEKYELSCDELFFVRSEATRGDVLERRLDLAAIGRVRSTLLTAGRRIVLEQAEEMHIERMERVSLADPDQVIESRTELDAKRKVRARMQLGADQMSLDCDELDVTRSSVADLEPAQEIYAKGNVRFSGKKKVSFQGEGDLLEIRPDGTATLSAAGADPVRLSGVLPSREIPFRMTARQVTFSELQIVATDPDLLVRGHHASARKLTATQLSMELEDDVELSGSTEKHDWILRAGAVSIAEDPRGEAGLADLADRSDWDSPGASSLLSRLRASEGFEFELGDLIVAKGDRFTSGGNALGLLRMTGDPMASISTPFGVYEAQWIEFDPALQIVVETGPGNFRRRRPDGAGKLRQGDGGPGGNGVQEESTEEDKPWTASFLSSSTMFDGNDSLVYLLQEPRFEYPAGDQRLNASWVALWIDRKSWETLDQPEEEVAPDDSVPRVRAPAGIMGLFFDAVRKSNARGLIHGAYFEGPVEAFQGEERLALAEAVYFDLDTGEGYLVNAAVTIKGQRFGGNLEQIRIQSKLIRHLGDGTLNAKNATITSCSFDEPHVRIVTGDLNMTPLSDVPEGGYTITLHQNRIEFDWLHIPLPPLEFEADKNLKPHLPSLRFGSSARFGQLLGIRLRGSAKPIGRFFDYLFSSSEPEVTSESADSGPGEQTAGAPPNVSRPKKPELDAHYDLDASYLGSRGALFDFGVTTERAGEYWFEFLTGVVLDGGRDKGYVRVPEGERDYTRLWLRSQGWFDLGNHQHLVTAYSDQSDPGVQSEFFESEFSTYDRDESYVQWKRAENNLWMQASVRPRVDEFSAGVEELPSFTAYRSRASIADIGPLPLIHTGGLDVAYLRRVPPRRYDLDGNGSRESTLASPYGPSGVYPDGTAGHDALRVDVEQMLELPISLGVLGVKLVPFASVRGTSWSTAAQDTSATRAVTEGGARLSTVLWKRVDDTKFHQLAPYVQYRAELTHEADGVPHIFDETETELYGDFVEVGTRARFNVENGRSLFDLDIRSAYASDRSDGKRNGWLPIEVYGRLGLGSERRPFDVWYDTRIDTSVGEAIYSLFAVGKRVDDKYGIQLAHQFGRNDLFVKQFDAISTRGFYRWTDKWEFEAQHSFSLMDDLGLGFDFLIRRYGHDVVFELETSVREGEGSSVGFNIRPRLGFRPNRIGVIHY